MQHQYENDIKYGEASLKARERFASQVKNDLNKHATDSGLKFIRLTEQIPNWETYLTPKQLESARKFIKTLNTYEVDYQLRLNSGTSHQRLFGNATSKGAIGRLEEVYKKLEQNGYYEEQRKKQEAAQAQSKQKKITLSPKTIESVRELLKLIVEMPDYEMFLTKSQAEKVYHFIRLRNFAATARACKISQDALKKALVGKDGALERLQNASAKRTVSKWEDI